MENKKQIFYVFFALALLLVLVVNVEAYDDPYVTSQTETTYTTVYCNWNRAGVVCDNISADGNSWAGSVYLVPGGNCGDCPRYRSGATGCHGSYYTNTCGGTWCINNPSPRENYTRTTSDISTTYTCNYISQVDEWLSCDSVTGLQWADPDGITWSSISGTSCENVDLFQVCSNGGNGGNGGNSSPDATDLLVVEGDYCVTASHFFSWIYSDSDGDSESKYQIQIDNDIGFNSSEVDKTFDISLPSSSNNTYIAILGSEIDYNTTYYWRIKVWDDQDEDSGWINGSSFVTRQQYPSADFSWSPQNPSQGEDIAFTSATTNEFGSYSWNFENGLPSISSEQTQIVQFDSDGSKQIKLQVTNLSGNSCEKSQLIDVGWSLPGWQEVLPW